MGCCLDADGAYSQPMAWGNFMELVIFNLLGIEYKIASKQTFLHPVHGEFWSGSADLIVPNIKIGEIKCYQKKKFAQYTDALIKEVSHEFTLSDKIESIKKDFPEEYWQLVSNAVIQQVPNAEAITYMPFESEMIGIKELANDFAGDDAWKYRFITEKPLEQLPVLKDGGYYNNINKFEFEVPKEDIEHLTNQMILASKELCKRHKIKKEQ